MREHKDTEWTQKDSVTEYSYSENRGGNSEDTERNRENTELYIKDKKRHCDDKKSCRVEQQANSQEIQRYRDIVKSHSAIKEML